jgi:hypothetical protein
VPEGGGIVPEEGGIVAYVCHRGLTAFALSTSSIVIAPALEVGSPPNKNTSTTFREHSTTFREHSTTFREHSTSFREH